MAKINKVSRQISYHKVRIFVEDPDCSFSIKPKMDYMKVFKSNNPNVAIRAAANYCNKYMKEYPGTNFKYSTKEVVPYNYYDRVFVKEED
jgi:hypothetical protein